MVELKKKVEAILFSAGRYLSVQEIARFCGRQVTEDEVRQVLEELKQEYDQLDSSMTIIHEEDVWKLDVRDAFIPVVRKVVTQTELPKSVMETLAVIAFKAPVLQSEVIKVRTNKAYDHIRDLEERGFIMRKPEGRTKRIDLTQKFFDYFDLPREQLQKRFAKVRELQENVEYLEGAVADRKRAAQEKQDEARQKEEEIKQEHTHTAEELEEQIRSHPGIEVPEHPEEQDLLETYRGRTPERWGGLEVVDEPPLPVQPPKEGSEEWGSLTIVKTDSTEKSVESSDKPSAEKSQEPDSTPDLDVEEQDVEKPETERRLFEGGVPEEVESRVQSRVEELLHPEKERTRKEEEAAAKQQEWESSFSSGSSGAEHQADTPQKEEAGEARNEKKEALPEKDGPRDRPKSPAQGQGEPESDHTTEESKEQEGHLDETKQDESGSDKAKGDASESVEDGK